MLFLMTFVPFLFIGCSLVWGILDLPWVARSPFRIAVVGLFTCAAGFFMQTQIHHTENLPVWLLQKIPMFSVDRAVLEFFDKLIDVLIYAAGAGIVASALFLRAQLRFEKERREQTKIRDHVSEKLVKIERDLKFLEVDARIHGMDNTQERLDAISQILDRYEKKLEKTNRILKAMGE